MPPPLYLLRCVGLTTSLPLCDLGYLCRFQIAGEGVCEGLHLVACDSDGVQVYVHVSVCTAGTCSLCRISVKAQVCGCSRGEPSGRVQIWPLLLLSCETSAEPLNHPVP